MSYGNSLISPYDGNLRPTNRLNVNSAGFVSVNLKSDSQIFGNVDKLSHNRTTQPNVTLPASGPQRTRQLYKIIQFTFNFHPVLQSPVMCDPSTIPLRLPKQSSQKLGLVLSENPVKQMRLVLSKMRWKQENEFMSKIILSLKMIY